MLRHATPLKHEPRVNAMPPTVTVFIPVYNRAHLVASAIRSVLEQSFRDFECLLVDDGSTDEIADVVDATRDPRIRLVRNPRNLGIPRTRNRGIELATGNYLAVLDSDDIALPHRLERQVAFLDARPEMAAVGSWVQPIDGEGQLAKKVRKCPASPRAIAFSLLFRTVPQHSSMVFRRSALEGLRYREDFPVMQDREFLGRLAHRKQIGCVQEVLVHLRQHEGRITNDRRFDRDALSRKNADLRLRELGLECTPEERDAVFDAAASIWFKFLKRARTEVAPEVLSRHFDSKLSAPYRARMREW